MQKRRGRFGLKKKECRIKFTYSCSTQIGFGVVASAASTLMALRMRRMHDLIPPDGSTTLISQEDNEKEWADAYHMPNTNSAITNLFKDLEDESS